jgi:Glycosyl hydrolase family 92
MKKSAFSNKNGLEYYASALPMPLNDAMVAMKSLYRFPQDKYIVGQTNQLVAGYSQTISGQQLTYNSAHPQVNSSIIARCGDGNRTIEWQPAAAPKQTKAANTTYVWLSGLASGLGAHSFDFYINDKKYFDFSSYKDSSSTGWVKLGPDGAKLSFSPTYIDKYNDVFGMMYLELPANMANVPLKFKVVGADAASRDFFFVHQLQLSTKLSVEKEFTVGTEGDKKYRFVKLIIESLVPPTTADISVDNDTKNSTQVMLYPGVNIVWLKLESAAKKVKYTFNIKSALVNLTESLELEPLGNINYIPADREHESVSKALEYAYDDWCIAQIANALGKTDDYNLFMARAAYYKNYYDSSTGFMRGKKTNGDWVSPFNPMFATNKQPEYTEGNAWQYSWFVPHDVDGLVALMGGKERFIGRLDTLFTQKLDLGPGAPPDVSGLIGLYAHGNEPSHHIAYLYAAVGQPAKTQSMVRRIMRTLYNDSNAGLCGNEDCGQMSAWYIFSALGFYPLNPADGKYYIGSPMVKKASLKLDNGKTFSISTQNQSDANVYIKQLLLNGKELATPYITHADILAGGTLEFIMTDKPQ